MPETVTPLAGDVRETVGEVVSAGDATLKEIDCDVLIWLLDESWHLT